MIKFRKDYGSIEVICGCMGSGKSQELIRIINYYLIADKKVIGFKPSIDSRDQMQIKSRTGSTYSANVISVANSQEILDNIKGHYDLVAIDEAQFFDKEIVDVVKNISIKSDVVISGLEKDYAGNPFGPMPELLAIADNVEKLKAICVCCKKSYATFTYRKGNSTEQILIGGDSMYEARCKECWSIR